MKLSEIIKPEFTTALAALKNNRLPGKASYRVASLIKLVRAELSSFEEFRKDLLERLADKDADGRPIIENGAYKLSDESLKQFGEEMKGANDADVELGAPIKISDLGEGFSIEPQHLDALGSAVSE